MKTSLTPIYIGEEAGLQVLQAYVREIPVREDYVHMPKGPIQALLVTFHPNLIVFLEFQL